MGNTCSSQSTVLENAVRTHPPPGDMPGNSTPAYARMERRQSLANTTDEIKVLLLGPDRAGRTTLVKQLYNIFKSGFTKEQRMHFRVEIHRNIVRFLTAMLNRCTRSGLEIAVQNKIHAKNLVDTEISLGRDREFMTPAIRESIMEVWKDKAVQQEFHRSEIFRASNTTSYFFAKERISDVLGPDYVPTDTDIVNSSSDKRLFGASALSDIAFKDGDLRFRMWDIGIQGANKKKWKDAVSHVSAIIFVTSLAEYDQTHEFLGAGHRLKESLLLFDRVCNSPYFYDTPIVLLLNKMDVFEAKIKHTDLRCCFPDYSGGLDYNNAIKFITNKFASVNRSTWKPLYTYVVTAIDKSHISKAFETIKKILTGADSEESVSSYVLPPGGLNFQGDLACGSVTVSGSMRAEQDATIAGSVSIGANTELLGTLDVSGKTYLRSRVLLGALPSLSERLRTVRDAAGATTTLHGVTSPNEEDEDLLVQLSTLIDVVHQQNIDIARLKRQIGDLTSAE